MAKVYIFTDDGRSVEFSGDILDEYLTDLYLDRIFILSEDSQNLFLTEDGSSVLIQEYQEYTD